MWRNMPLVLAPLAFAWIAASCASPSDEAAEEGSAPRSEDAAIVADRRPVASDSPAAPVDAGVNEEAPGEDVRLRLGLAAAADYSPVYPTAVLPTTDRLSIVFRFPPGERREHLTGKLVAVDVGDEAPAGSEVGTVNMRLQGQSRGALHYTLPRPFPPGAYRLEVSADGEPWASLDFRIAPLLEAAVVTDPAGLMPLEPGTVWTYAFSQEAGAGAQLDLPESLEGSDGIYRATATLSIGGLEDPGAHLVLRRSGQIQTEEWLRANEGGIVSTGVREDGTLVTLDPPRPFFPMPSDLPREWRYAAGDGSFTLEYRMWGPVPVEGPAGQAPGYVVLVRHEGPAVTTAERHFILGIGMVREIIVLGLNGRMLSRQEMVLRSVTRGGGVPSGGGQPR